MRTKRIGLVAALALAGVTVSGCRYGHPGHNSDRHGHGHHHGGDHDHDHDRDHDRYR